MIASRTTLVVALLTLLMVRGAAQEKPVVLQGQWGDMLEESPAKPLADSADATVRFRQLHMRATSASFRSLEVLIKDGRGRSELALAKAGTLVSLAESNHAVFAASVPAVGEFGTKPQVWSEPDLFGEHVAGFVSATNNLERQIREKTASQLAPALTAVRYQCLACHYHYAAFKDRPGKPGRRAP